MMFQDGDIDGVVFDKLTLYKDQRGWLIELYREDEVAKDFHPVMGYMSMTHAGIARGPHEHREQADLFCFLGPSTFKLYLWDNRTSSKTYQNRISVLLGEDDPQSVIIPPGVVHAYKNVGSDSGLVYNFPNQLFQGPNRSLPVDEIRHEDDPETIFVLD